VGYSGHSYLYWQGSNVFLVLFLFYKDDRLMINIMHATAICMSTAETLQNTKWQSCIDACMRCAEACEFCATSDLREQDVKMMTSCAQINRECAAVCWTSAALMSMDSQFSKQLCSLCVDICDACANECERHNVDHCKICAQTCRSCAEECRRMAR
jgi:Domain of Unknown Function (DUF326)